HLTVITLQVAMRFVGNYALRGLSPQTDGMPVIPKKPQDISHGHYLLSLNMIGRLLMYQSPRPKPTIYWIFCNPSCKSI
ncbi:MAG: hypothetical protein E6Y91_07745, partial [Peptostreptococcus anaerobius]|nr:hypothetical protein [Peptostreptococcus anaerobius]